MTNLEAHGVAVGASSDRATAAPVKGAGRRGAGPAVVLIAAACMPILGSTSIAPIQPAIVDAYPGQAGADGLVSMILTVPALIIGLTAFFIGGVIDRIGRKSVLVWGLVAYAVVGTAPIYLPSLQTILGSRVLVGFTEAAIFAASTALIADYFTGTRRSKYYGVMNMVTGLSAVVFIAVSGALGQGNWRAPFWLYALALPISVVAFAVLPKVARGRSSARLPRLDRRRILRPVVFTLIGGVIFYVPVSMLSFKINDIGTTNTGIIGAVSAIAAIAMAVGAGTFHKILRRSPAILAPLAFGLLGVGLIGLGLAQSVPQAAVAAVIANLGGGFIIPTLQNWSVQSVDYDQRGRASGAFSSALFVGQFIGPVVLLGIVGRSHLSWSIGIVGAIGVLMAVVATVATAGHIRPNEEMEAD